MAIKAFDPFTDMCPFCLDELRGGARDNGICEHEEVLTTYPHLRFNASDRLDAATLQDSRDRFAATFGQTVR